MPRDDSWISVPFCPECKGRTWINQTLIGHSDRYGTVTNASWRCSNCGHCLATSTLSRQETLDGKDRWK